MLFHTIIKDKIVFRVVFDVKINKKSKIINKIKLKYFFTKQKKYVKNFNSEVWKNKKRIKQWQYIQELKGLKLKLKLI